MSCARCGIAGDVWEQPYVQAAQPRHHRGSAFASLRIFAHAAVLLVVQSVFNFPVASGQNQQRLGPAVRFRGFQAGEVMVILNNRSEIAAQEVMRGSNAEDLAQPRPSTAPTGAAMPVTRHIRICPQFVRHDFQAVLAALFSSLLAVARRRRSCANASSAMATSVLCGAFNCRK